MGSLAEGKQSLDALRRAAQLDQSNAMPLYLLASEAASRGSWDEALLLLKQGNGRKECTDYPLAIRSFTLCEQSALDIAGSGLEAQARLRDLERGFSERATTLHLAGRTDEALAVLAAAKRAGWAVVHGRQNDLMDMMVSVSMVRIVIRGEDDIYHSMGDRAGLADVAREKRRVRYLLAGAEMHVGRIMPDLVNRWWKFFAPMLTILPLVLEVWLALIVIVLFAVLALRSRRETASAHHLSATAQAFPISRLLKLYALIFLPIGIAAAIIVRATFDASELLSFFLIATVAVLLPSTVLHCCASTIYKRAYGAAMRAEASDVPRLWKGVAIGEKREVARRLAGVHGGAVVFLVVLGLLISGGTKLALGAFPWQGGLDFEDSHRQERRYVADLVAGKIKVPESDIRKQER